MIAVVEKLRQGWKRQQGESWEDLLWRLYLNDCLAQRPPQPKQEPDAHDRKYGKDKSRHWLHCLARWMQKENKVALQIDELQPSMLKGYWRFGMLYGLFFGLSCGLVGWLFTHHVIGLILGLVVWLLFGLPGCLDRDEEVKAISGIVGTLAFVPFFGPITSMMIGMFFVITTNNKRKKIDPIQSLHLPCSIKDGQFFIAWLITGLIGGLSLGLLSGLMLGSIKAGGISLGPWLALMSAAMLILGLMNALAQGLKAVAVPFRKTIQPQERLNDALCSSLILFPLFILIGMEVFIHILFQAEQIRIPVTQFRDMPIFYGALFGTIISSFIYLGTNQALQHYLLRLCLRWEGQLPLRLVPWLEAMHQRKVLQRVGGSYHFLHKQLQEYLAKRTEAV